MRIREMGASHPLTVLVARLDESIARSAASNAATALASERARREQWHLEEEAVGTVLPAPRSA